MTEKELKSLYRLKLGLYQHLPYSEQEILAESLTALGLELQEAAVRAAIKTLLRHPWRLLLRNWPVHNILAHPLAELCYWAGFVFRPARSWGTWLHDATVPPRQAGTGRD